MCEAFMYPDGRSCNRVPALHLNRKTRLPFILSWPDLNFHGVDSLCLTRFKPSPDVKES